MPSDSRVIVALDFDNQSLALTLADQLDPSQCRLKVGKELFTAAGPALVKALVERDFEVFLDLKFHDIPNTVAKAITAAADLGVWMANVHACGGSRMMKAAKQALVEQGSDMQLIAVTVLTSMDDADLLETGVQLSPKVVCSAREASALKSRLGADFKLITPGIRLPNSAADDQRRIVSPADAVALGSDYLVIGRPITQSAQPLETLQQINHSLK